MKKPLPTYEKCKYSLFISYANSDNVTDSWVSCLHEVTEKHLEAALKDNKIDKIKKTRFHGKEDLYPGSIDKNLKDEIDSSFAMLLVVGTYYANSDWCKEELEYFWESFGEDGIESRLFIVAMTPDAIDKAYKKDNWLRILGKKNERFWKRFFYEDGNNRNVRFDPKDAYTFSNAVTQLFIPLVEKINNDCKSFQPPTNYKFLTIATSDTKTPELQKDIKAMQKKLEDHGANFLTIKKEMFLNYDQNNPDDEIRKILEKADVLIVPFQIDKLFIPIYAGGHLSILEEEWEVHLKKNKDKIFWYNPFGDVSSIAENDKHYKIINNLKPIYQSSDDVCSRISQIISDAEKNKEIIIRIGKEQGIKVAGLLTEKISEVWEKVIKNNPFPQTPKIRIESLDYENLKDKKNLAHGYVLVKIITKDPPPTGKLNMTTTRTKADEVEKAFPYKVDYPGRIALLFPEDKEPNDNDARWPTIKCKIIGSDVATPYDIDLLPDGEPVLEEFLKKLLRQYNKVNQLLA